MKEKPKVIILSQGKDEAQVATTSGCCKTSGPAAVVAPEE